MIRFNCPECGMRLKADIAYVGQAVRCTRCKARLIVPGDERRQTVQPQPETSNAAAGKADDQKDWEFVLEPVAKAVPQGMARPGPGVGPTPADSRPAEHSPLEPPPGPGGPPKKKKRKKSRRRQAVSAGLVA